VTILVARGDHLTRLYDAARIAMKDVIGLREGEEVLIVTNFEGEVFPIARAVFDATKELGGKPVMLVQGEKSQFDFAERLVNESIRALPDVCVMLTANKLGKDPYGMNIGYVGRDGQKYNSIFNKVWRGDRRIRTFFSPGITQDIFTRAVPVDYAKMRTAGAKLKKVLDEGNEVKVTSPGGTDATVDIKDRKAHADDGNFTLPGLGGNLPAGEVYISPVVQGVSGTIVIDGTITLSPGSVIPKKPIRLEMKDGYVTKITGGEDAKKLIKVIEKGEEMAREKGLAEQERNARHIGELGIGINPKAKMTGILLEDEKLGKTVHFAIGSNFDQDAEAMIHLDGLVMKPDMWVDGKQIMKNGDLII
jgi:leucyl aminopeptidase (aminopeptidase T)